VVRTSQKSDFFLTWAIFGTKTWTKDMETVQMRKTYTGILNMCREAGVMSSPQNLWSVPATKLPYPQKGRSGETRVHVHNAGVLMKTSDTWSITNLPPEFLFKLIFTARAALSEMRYYNSLPNGFTQWRHPPHDFPPLQSWTEGRYMFIDRSSAGHGMATNMVPLCNIITIPASPYRNRPFVSVRGELLRTC
jgi:hypothetical protein